MAHSWRLLGRIGVLAALPLAVLAQLAPCQSPAELNDDGILDAADVVTVVRESAEQPDPERYDALDLNQDGVVNLLDAMKAARAILMPDHPFPPDLDIDTPSRDLRVTANSVVPISGTIGAASTLRLNGEAFAENVTGAFQTTAFLQPGLNILEIDASPEDGGIPARQAFSIVLDVNPPRVILAAPAPSTATPSETITVRGTVIDETRATVRVASPAGEVDAVVDGFGEWTAQVPLLTGLNDIAIVATDEVGLANATTVRVRRFTSPAQEATSGDGARIMFPEGAFPSEDMAVALHDVTNSELDAILGFDVLSAPPPGGLGNGVIVMPAGMMLEVQGAPDNGEPLFMKDIQVSIPNTGGADNSMPIWIFQIQPDIDGDGMPQLSVISRGKVSEDGMTIVPVDEPLGPVDDILPGVMSADNRRFDENEFDQISPARAVRELMDRIEGKAPRLRTGPNVAHAKGNPLTNLGGPAPRRADAVLPALLEQPAPSAPPEGGVTQPHYRGGGTLLVDNFEDGDTVNLLMPAGVTYTAFDESYSSAADPLRPDPLLSTHIPDEGNPARRLPEPFGVNGGVPLRGTFADGVEFAEARIVTKLLAGEHPLILAGLENLVLKFDARSTVFGATYQVTLEDKTGPGNYIEYMPEDDWDNFVFPVDLFAVNVSDLQRITWRVTGEGGVTVDLQIDNPEFMWMDGTPPPPPTFVPTPTFVDPTPPPFTPTPSPTVTPIPTSTPVADPTPTPGGSSTPTPVFPTPTDSTVPTVTPESPEDDPDDMQPKTQVTFYCCAASAIIPFTGTTECDDDENVDQQRLRECISETLTSYIRCQQNVRRMLAELDGTVAEMESGYDTMFGATTINGRKVPLIVNGSLFQSVPWGLGATGAANNASQASINLLQAGTNGIADINAMDAAIASGDRNAVNQALLNGSSNSLNTVVNSMILLGDAGAGPGLQARTGFRAAWRLTNVAANLYKTVKGAKGYINGFFLGEPLAEAIDLEGNRCARLFNQLRDLRNCNRGSNAWLSCVEEPEDGGRAWAALEKEGMILEGIRAKGAMLRERLAEVGTAANFIGEFGELNLGTMEHFVEGIDLSARFEADFASMTDEEVIAMATAYRNKMEQAANGFLLMGNSVDGLLDAINVATEGLEVIDMSREYVADSNAALAMLDEMESVNSQGSEGAFVALASQHASSIAKSGPGGAFLGYKHAFVARVGNTVTFTGGTAMANADMDTTPMTGAREVEFPTLEYKFTPSSTVEFDGFAEVGQIGMAVGADDREGDPPTVEMLFPNPSGPTIALPPGAPYLLRARATDDILTYSTRFRIDGEPTVALGSTDQPDNPQPTTFSAYFLAPEIDARRGGIQTLVVSAEAIDSGGNIGTSGNVAINVDPDAPLLATITPELISTTAGAGGRQFTATITSSGASLPSPRWFVEGVLGGNSRFGTITQGGFYIPPAATEAYTENFRIQVISEAMPELVGEATVLLTQPTVPSHVATVLNLLAPQRRTGFEHADPVSVLGLFVPLDRVGLADAEPVSVLGNFAPERRTGSSEAQPVSVQNNTP